MKNETFEARVLKEHTPEPLEGHTVVVFERVGEAGEKFHSLLPSGTPMPKEGGLLRTMFGRKVDYFAYAVDASPELHVDFNEHVVSADHVHEFDLLFDLYFCVEDPRVLASTRNSDPLGTVRRKVGAVIASKVAEVPWGAVWHDFRSVASSVVQDDLRTLCGFAAQYGIGIRSVELDLQLPEEETSTLRKVERGKTDVKMRTGLTLAELAEQETIDMAKADHASRLRTHTLTHDLSNAALEEMVLAAEIRRRTMKDLSTAGSRALGNIGNHITSAVELRDAIRAGREALEITNGAGDQTLLDSAPAGPSTPVLAMQGSLSRLAGLVQEMVGATQNVVPSAQKNALRSTILHLTAEVLADGATDANRQEEYAQRARTLVAELDPSPGSAEMEVLRRLIDTSHLRNTLFE